MIDVIDCDHSGEDGCMEAIGSIKSPIYCTKDHQIVCRVCFERIEGRPPRQDEAEYL